MLLILIFINIKLYSQYYVKCLYGKGKIFQMCTEFYSDSIKKAEWISLTKRNALDTVNSLDSLIILKKCFIDVSVESYDNVSDSTTVTVYNYTRAWYKNGKIKEEVCFVDSNGTKKKYFYENGQLEKEGYFLNNKKNGIWIFYNEDGILSRKEFWDSGMLMSRN